MARFSGTYQGLPLKSVQFRRSDGLNPEQGFATMDYSDAKNLKLNVDAVPWRGADGGPDFPGPMSIRAWHELKSKGSGTKAKPKASTGLNLSGQLILKDESGEGIGDTVTIEGVYVDNAEEISQDLANAQEHSDGEILIEFSDVRRFYPDHGALLGRINCRLRGGIYDPLTVKNPKAKDDRGVGSGKNPTITKQDDEAWPFRDVIEFLFSQLPGSPEVHLDGLKDLPEPEEIDQVGTSIVNVIKALLDDYRLVAKMQPDGSYLIAKQAIKHLAPGEVAPSIGNKAKPKNVAYETKSVTFRHIPPVAMVLGRRRLRRMTCYFVPVFKDVDERIYRLSDIGKLWDGYSLDQVNRQVPLQPHKSFQDVPPALVRRQSQGAADAARALSNPLAVLGFSASQAAAAEEAADLHFRRQEIMRNQAYQLYAPARLFDEDAAKRNHNGVPFLEDRDQTPVNWLPMMEAPLYEKELKEIFPRSVPGRSGMGGVVLTPPVVRGARTCQVFYTDAFKATFHIRHRISSNVAWLNELAPAMTETLKKTVAEISATELRTQESVKSGKDLDSKIASSIWGATGIDFGINGRYAKVMEKLVHIEADKEAAEDEVRRVKILAESVISKIADLERDFLKIIGKFFTEGGIHLTGNLPHGVIPGGAYALDTTTGLLKFPDPVCVFMPPLVLNPETAIVAADGGVTVTFGHEVNRNEPTDFSSILFARDKGGKVEMCGACRPSHVKPYVIHDPDLQILEDDLGNPMNFEHCANQARRKAEPLLSGEPAYEGYKAQYSGFVKCVLERSVDSVQYVWDGDQAHTTVAINAPKCDMPLGSPKTPGYVDVENPSNIARKRAGPIGGAA